MSAKAILPQNIFWIFFGLITIVHLSGLVLIDIMDVDAAQYASMSREMMDNGEFLQVQHREADYLDKPPLLFWVTSISFEMFGVGNFTFRLASFLFLLVGVFSTYKLGEFYYDKRTGLLAALVLYSCQAYFLFSHDVRTDTILANVLVFGLWQLAVFLKFRTFSSIVLGAVGVGLAMLEKGPIGLMVAAWAVGSQIIYKRSWSTIWRWEWFVGLLVLVLMLAPMTYGLYKQFGMSGVEFYYWTQSFGRITGQSEWRDNSTVFYFVHTFLWAFLPWMFLAYYGVVRRIYLLFKTKFASNGLTEVLTLGGFLITFAALSLSNYKLPHYIFVVFPLVAIITADTIWHIIDTQIGAKTFVVLSWITSILLWIAVGLLSVGSFAAPNVVIGLLGLAALVITFYLLISNSGTVAKIVYTALITIIGVNLLLDTHFYPSLLKYQAGSVAGKYIKYQQIDPDKVFFYNGRAHSYDFYAEAIIEEIDISNMATGVYVITNDPGLEMMQEAGIEFQIEKDFDSYPVTQLSLEFLRPSTRSGAIKKEYLIKIL